MFLRVEIEQKAFIYFFNRISDTMVNKCVQYYVVVTCRVFTETRWHAIIQINKVDGVGDKMRQVARVIFISRHYIYIFALFSYSA